MQPTSEELQTASEDRTGSGVVSPTIRISAILPIFAEERIIADTVSELRKLAGDWLHEIILLVAASPPAETLRICEETAAAFPGVRISVQKRNPGLGLAVRQGIDEAQGTHILLMDCDGEMDVETVPRMIAALEGGAVDMVVASRWMKGGGVDGYDPIKYLLNRAYQMIFQVLFLTPIHDLTLGFKLVRAEVMKGFSWNSEFHDIGCETTLRPIRAGFRVAEVPTVWSRRKEGASANPFRNNFKYVWKALAIRFEKPQKSQKS